MKFPSEGEFWHCHFAGSKMGASNQMFQAALGLENKKISKVRHSVPPTVCYLLVDMRKIQFNPILASNQVITFFHFFMVTLYILFIKMNFCQFLIVFFMQLASQTYSPSLDDIFYCSMLGIIVGYILQHNIVMDHLKILFTIFTKKKFRS